MDITNAHISKRNVSFRNRLTSSGAMQGTRACWFSRRPAPYTYIHRRYFNITPPPDTKPWWPCDGAPGLWWRNTPLAISPFTVRNTAEQKRPLLRMVRHDRDTIQAGTEINRDIKRSRTENQTQATKLRHKKHIVFESHTGGLCYLYNFRPLTVHIMLIKPQSI